MEDQDWLEGVFVIHLCKNGSDNDQRLIFQLDEKVVDLLDQEFNWRANDLHVRKWLSSDQIHSEFHQGLHKVTQPTEEEILEEVWAIISNAKKSLSHVHWARVVRKAELLPRKTRHRMSDKVFELLIKSISVSPVQPLDEGLNALDRLFKFTRSKRNLYAKYREKLNEETAFLNDLLPALRKNIISPLTEKGYEQGLFRIILRILLRTSLSALIIALCIYFPPFGFGILITILYFLMKKLARTIFTQKKRHQVG